MGIRVCLLLRGCSSPVTNRSSLIYIQDTHRGLFIQQLRPTQNLQPRIKLKLFGHSGSGKTTLVESLKCGLLRSFFRRRRPRLSSTNSTRFPPSPLASKPAGKHPTNPCLSTGYFQGQGLGGGVALFGALGLRLTGSHCLGGFQVWSSRLLASERTLPWC